MGCRRFNKKTISLFEHINKFNDLDHYMRKYIQPGLKKLTQTED